MTTPLPTWDQTAHPTFCQAAQRSPAITRAKHHPPHVGTPRSSDAQLPAAA